ncbi:hypothetical protein [Pseudobythopirellula maris]|nr:hypothetical protein [Pseudobythopirellula maris]
MLVIETRQAGERIPCSCGATVEAPPLRKIRELQPIQQAEEPTSAWSYRHGVLTAGLLAALGLALLAGWFETTKPAPPAPFDATIYQKSAAEGIDNLTPLQAWALWKQRYEPLAVSGLQPMTNQENQIRDLLIARSDKYRNGLLIAAAAVAVITAGAFACLPK